MKKTLTPRLRPSRTKPEAPDLEATPAKSRARTPACSDAARLHLGAAVADRMVVRALTFFEVLSEPSYDALVATLVRADAPILQARGIRDTPTADRVSAQITAALPLALQGALGRLKDWFAFEGTCQAEAAYLVGLGVGRGGAR